MGTPSQKQECTSVPDLPVDFVKLELSFREAK